MSLCPYCDFVVYSGRDARGPGARVETFVRALLTELELRADARDQTFPARSPLGSVYLGGGTPSLLPPATVERLLSLIDARFGLATDAEITLEANPRRDEIGDLAGFRAAGVNRLSIGVQSLDARELREIGRRHRPEDVSTAVTEARGAGFRNISLDLLYDLPGQTLESWARTLQGVVELQVEHVSAYALTLDDPAAEGLTGPTGDHLPTRAGARLWRERARRRQDGDRAAAMYEAVDARLAAAGLPWYELSNWARPGRESRHNLVYWTGEAYEALGPGAHAFDGGAVRRWNAARLDGYLAALAPSSAHVSLPPGGHEELDERVLIADRAMLGLRLRAGIAPALATAAPVAAAMEWGRRHGLIERAVGDHERLSDAGRLLSNEVFVRLLADRPAAEAMSVG